MHNGYQHMKQRYSVVPASLKKESARITSQYVRKETALTLALTGNNNKRKNKRNILFSKSVLTCFLEQNHLKSTY